MKYKQILSFFAGACLMFSSLQAQEYNLTKFPKGSTPLEVGNRIANKFIVTPHTRFGNPRAEKAPNYITYPDVCAWLGALWFGKVTKNEPLLDKLKDRFEPLFSTEQKMLPRMNHVDHNVVGAVPLELYIQKKGDQRYYDLGMRYADTQWEAPVDATPEQKAYADKGYSWQTRIWIDDMFMITILQAQAYHTTGKREYMDRAVKEMVVYLAELQRPNGLFYHAPDVPYFWARGNGWMAVGMAELLLSTPEDNPNHARILEGYRLMMKSLKDYQDKSGMWNQLIDKADCWPETSGSAMFTYAMIMGVKKGWLDAEEYGPIARKAWIALVPYINKDGDVEEVCVGTGKKNDLQYYYDRPRIIGDYHGQAPMLWCTYALLCK